MTREQKERLNYLNNQIETAQHLTSSEYRELEKLQALERLDQAKAQLKEAEKANRLANFSLGFSVFVLVFNVAVLVWVLFT